MSKPTAAAPVETFFWESVIRGHWRKHQPEEPEIMDSRVAVYYLRKFTGLTVEEMAARLSVFAAVVSSWESRGRPFTRESLQRLERMAKDYGLLRIAEHFHGQDLAVAYRGTKARAAGHRKAGRYGL